MEALSDFECRRPDVHPVRVPTHIGVRPRGTLTSGFSVSLCICFLIAQFRYDAENDVNARVDL